MSLSLKITSYQRLTPNQQSVYRAESDSFTIGRNHENDWAIPDPQRFLSGVHCRIHQEGDRYFITDTSTNGVFLNGSEDRLTRNDPVDLKAGDKFRIGDYEFEVAMDDESLAGNPLTSNEETMIGADPFGDPFEAADTPPASDPFAAGDPFDDDDPFSEPAPDNVTSDQEDDFLDDIDKPLSSLGDNPLAGHMSIDSLMGFDDEIDQDGAVVLGEVADLHPVAQMGRRQVLRLTTGQGNGRQKDEAAAAAGVLDQEHGRVLFPVGVEIPHGHHLVDEGHGRSGGSVREDRLPLVATFLQGHRLLVDAVVLGVGQYGQRHRLSGARLDRCHEDNGRGCGGEGTKAFGHAVS